MKKILLIVLLTGFCAVGIKGQISTGRLLQAANYKNTASLAKNNDILSVIDDINADSIRSYIQKLEQFGTRYETLENKTEISQWIYDKFRSFGFNDVKCDSFEIKTTTGTGSGTTVEVLYPQRNVVCNIPGSGAPEEKFILCAHYDSFSNVGSLPYEYAPGADDNASGVAALLEIARVFKLNNKQPKRTITLVALAAEELMGSMYSGSKYYAEELFALNENVRLVINHDMIGYTDKDLSQSSVNINRHSNSTHYADLAILSVNTYTKIKANHEAYWGADLRPFYEKGYHGVYFEENIFSPFYHSSNDVIGNVNLAYCTEVIKGSCAFAMWASSIPNYVTGISAERVSNADNAIRFKWNPNTDFDFYFYVLYLSKNNGTTFEEHIAADTTLVISNITDLSSIKYAVAARSLDGYESLAEIFDFSITSVSFDDKNLTTDFVIGQNYPNPFNPVTHISYQLSKKGIVSLKVYDILGGEIETLVAGIKEAGHYDCQFDGKALASGTYIYRLSVDGRSIAKKMLLLK